jgi:hypothetical protein
MSCCCLWITAKVELHAEDSLEPLFGYCHNKFTRADFIHAEAEILSAVDYQVHSVTSHFFLKRFLSVISADERVALIASYLCESTLLFLELSSFRPSMIAFCAIAGACFALNCGQLLQNLVRFRGSVEREDLERCFGLVMRGGESLAVMEKHSPFRKYGARPIDGVMGGGAGLIKSVEFGADLLQRMTTLWED